MKQQIDIGTCIPGGQVEQWLPAMVQAGFECVSINFHMSLGGVDLRELASKIKEILGDSGVYVTSLGYYCNALQYEDHRETLAHCIDVAHLFGASTVCTFAGGLEGESVEAAIQRGFWRIDEAGGGQRGENRHRELPHGWHVATRHLQYRI